MLVEIVGRIVNYGAPVYIGVQGDNNVTEVAFKGIPELHSEQDVLLYWYLKRADEVAVGDIARLTKTDEGSWLFVVTNKVTQYAGEVLTAHVNVTHDGASWNSSAFPLSLTSVPRIDDTVQPFTPTLVEGMVTSINEHDDAMMIHREAMDAQELRVNEKYEQIVDFEIVADIVDGRLPNVYIEADYLEGWTGKEDERIVKLAYRSRAVDFDAWAKMKPQGTSSLAYPKKNFTLKLYGDENVSKKKKVKVKEEWGAEDKYVIKADWIDPTHSGNVVSARLAGKMNAAYGIFPDAPNSGCIDGFPVLVHMNGRCVGIYNWNIPKDGWMMGFSGDDEDTALILCDEAQSGVGSFRGLLTGFSDATWSVEYGAEDASALEAFNRVAAFIKDSSDTDFRAHFEEYINLDAALNYYCFAYLATAVDNLGKNMLFVTPDRLVWYPILYDLDSLWGVHWNGKETVPYNRKCPDEYDCRDSLLWEKLVRCFPNELADRYDELRGGPLSTGSILDEFTRYMYGIPKRAYDEDTAVWSELSAMVRTLSHMRSYVPRRAQYVDYQFSRIRTASSGSYGRKLYELPAPFIGNGSSKYIDTGIRLFDNVERDWTLAVRFKNSIPSGDKVVISCFSEIYPYYEGLLIRGDTTPQVIVGKNYAMSVPGNSAEYLTVVVVKNQHSYRVFRDGVFAFKLDHDPLAQQYMGKLLIGCQDNSTFGKMRFSAVTVSSLVVYGRAVGDMDAVMLASQLQ